MIGQTKSLMKTETNNILSLIVATIFADKRIYASEVDVFLKSTLSLKVLRQVEPRLSEAKLLNWYEMNKADIQAKITAPYFKDWFYSLLDQLSGLPEKSSVLNVMRDISVADGEVHVSERALITLAERHWGLR